MDFRPLNMILTRPGSPFKTTAKILRRLRPEDKIFMAIDLNESYFQVPVNEDDRDNLSFIVQLGKFGFNVYPMGLNPSTCMFNIVMKPATKNITTVYKNIGYRLFVTTTFDEALH